MVQVKIKSNIYKILFVQKLYFIPFDYKQNALSKKQYSTLYKQKNRSVEDDTYGLDIKGIHVNFYLPYARFDLIQQ